MEENTAQLCSSLRRAEGEVSSGNCACPGGNVQYGWPLLEFSCPGVVARLPCCQRGKAHKNRACCPQQHCRVYVTLDPGTADISTSCLRMPNFVFFSRTVCSSHMLTLPADCPVLVKPAVEVIENFQAAFPKNQPPGALSKLIVLISLILRWDLSLHEIAVPLKSWIQVSCSCDVQ